MKTLISAREKALDIVGNLEWATTRSTTSCSSRILPTKWWARCICAKTPATWATCTEPPVVKCECVCHISDSDPLLVCSYEKGPDQQSANWWHSFATATNGARLSKWSSKEMDVSVARWVLIGQTDSTFIELFRVESGLRIATDTDRRIDVREKYFWYSATYDSDTLVAISYRTNISVRVHRLREDRLQELAYIQLSHAFTSHVAR